MTERFQVYWIRLLSLFTIGTIVMAMISIVCAAQQIGRPYPGFLFEPPLVVSSLHTKDWPSFKAGMGYFDQILTANGQPLTVSDDLDRLVAGVPPGTPITYEYLHGGEKRSVTLKTEIFSVADMLAVVLPWILVGGTYLLVGVVAFWLKPDQPAVRAHLVLCLSMSLVLIGQAPYILAHRFAIPLVLSLPFMGAGYLHLALAFPRVPGFVQRRPYLIGAMVYLPAVVMALVATVRYRPAGFHGDRAAHDFYVWFVQSFYAYWSFLGMLAFLVAVIYATLRAPTPLARQQGAIVLVGSTLTLVLTFATYFLPVLLGTPGQLASKAEIAGQAILPVTVAYAILRHQLFNIQLIIRRGALYLSLTLVLAALYVVGAVTGHALVGQFFIAWSGASVSGFMAALAVAVAFRPVHDRLRRQIDRLFLGERADAMRALADFGQQPFPDLRTYAEELIILIQRSLSPQWVCLLRNGSMLAAGGKLPADWPAESRSRAAGSDDLSLTQALVAGGEVQGMLRIGPRTIEIPYSSEEQAMLRVLAAHAAVALQAGTLLEDQVRLKVSEGVARSLAAERESLLQQVVHDVRSDLFNINLVVHLGTAIPEAEALESIVQSMSRIDSLLEEKIRLIKQGRKAINCQLRDSLQSSAVEHAGLLREKRQILEMSLPEGEVTVPLSPVEFRQIVTNLLTNAHKFAPADTVIRLAASLDGQELSITVTDEGPGIPAELLATVASGQRGDPTVKGHGFGLQNIEALLAAVNGRLSWRNGPNGAIVQATIPLTERARRTG